MKDFVAAILERHLRIVEIYGGKAANRLPRSQKRFRMVPTGLRAATTAKSTGRNGCATKGKAAA
jgi:hypothetical protein